MWELGRVSQSHYWLKRKLKPRISVVSDDLLFCNHSPSFERFCVLTEENRKFVLELK